jgi:hypothetical protein
LQVVGIDFVREVVRATRGDGNYLCLLMSEAQQRYLMFMKVVEEAHENKQKGFETGY